jgi:hypothetical protein
MKVTEIVTRLKTMETEQRAGIKSSFAQARERAEKNAQALELARQIIDNVATGALLEPTVRVHTRLIASDPSSTTECRPHFVVGFNQPCTRDHICLTAAGGPCNGLPRNYFT